MSEADRLIRAFFDGAQPTMKLPDGTWFGSRPNDVMHELGEVRVRPDRTVIELEGVWGAGMRLVLDGPVVAEEVRARGIHELRISGFGRSVLEEGGRTRQWSGGVLTFVRWIPQGEVPPSVLR